MASNAHRNTLPIPMWLAAFIGVLVLPGVSLADPVKPFTSAQEIFKVHQNKFAVANDLKIKFWQMEDDVEVTGWKVHGVSGLLKDYPIPEGTRGSQPEPYHSGKAKNLHPDSTNQDPDNGKHAVDLAWDDLKIPKCQTVDVKFSWTLTEYNTKNFEAKWSEHKNGEPPAEKKAAPKVGWSVDDPVKTGDKWAHRVTIYNFDTPDEADPQDVYIPKIGLHSLDTPGPIDINELDTWSTWSFFDVFMDITLHPGESRSYDLLTDTAVRNVLGSFEGYTSKSDYDDPTKRAEAYLFTDTWEHSDIPEPCYFGALLVAFAGLLAATRRRWGIGDWRNRGATP